MSAPEFPGFPENSVSELLGPDGKLTKLCQTLQNYGNLEPDHHPQDQIKTFFTEWRDSDFGYHFRVAIKSTANTTRNLHPFFYLSIHKIGGNPKMFHYWMFDPNRAIVNSGDTLTGIENELDSGQNPEIVLEMYRIINQRVDGPA